MSGTAAPPSITVTIAGQVFNQVSRIRLTRDLQTIAGTFEIAIVDQARLKQALAAYITGASLNMPIKPGDPVTLSAGTDKLLVGWVERPRFRWTGDAIELTIRGRDKTGDLVECSALPSGPTEFRGVTLTQVAQQVCAPFGISVRAEVDVGAPFDRLALHKHQTALTFLEGAARQRSVLLVSDGVGGLLLTRGGSTRGPAPLAIGGNVQDVDVEFDWEQRFSDYYVIQGTTKQRTGGPALDSTVDPPETDPDLPDTPSSDSAAEAPSITDMGHATDPEITRWRPTVRLTRSQSGMDTVQEQAEWMCRVAKGTSDHVYFMVLEWRAGQDNALWRPNQVVPVTEPYSGINRDMLIAGVTFLYDETGRRTRLRVAGVTAYDRINEADRRRPSGRRKSGGGGASPDLITTVPPLEAQ